MFSKRPILIGGLGLAATFSLLDAVHFSVFNSSTLMGSLVLGAGLWWWQRRPSAPAAASPAITQTAVEQTLEKLEQLLHRIEQDAAAELADVAAAARQQQPLWLEHLHRSELTVGVVGEPGAGKSSLIAQLQAQLPEHTYCELSLCAAEAADCDAVLLVTAGDLTASGWDVLRNCVSAGQGAILVFNKSDHYGPAEQGTILQQLQQRAAAIDTAEGIAVVAAAAAPRPLRVRRHLSDGSVAEALEEMSPSLADLQQTLIHLAAARTQAWVRATTLRQMERQRRQLQAQLNRVWRQRAMPVVEQLQWASAVSAFAIPVASLDLIATAAINAQLLMDLGKIYGLAWSWDEAKTFAARLAELTVKLGLVELSTQALTAALKGHPATYAAGGLLQGLSAAYLTRMVGLSLIELLEAEALVGKTPAVSAEKLGARLQGLLRQTAQGQLLRQLIEQGRERLRPSAPAAAPSA